MYNIKNKISIVWAMFIVLMLLVVGTQFSSAQVLPQISVSAFVSNNKNEALPNGEYEIRFALYRTDRKSVDAYPSNSDASQRVWQETQKVYIRDGVLSVYLGASTPVPSDLNFSNTEYYLGIRINTDSEFVPRKKLGAVPFALDSAMLEGARLGTEEGNIPQLDVKGKIDIDMLPTGTGSKQLVLGNDSRLKKSDASAINSGILGVEYGGTGKNSLSNLISLGANTTGDYVSSVLGGNGISGGSAGSEGADITLGIDLLGAIDGVSSTTQSFSGLEFAGVNNDQLSLLQGCANSQVLSWDSGNKVWKCSNFVGASMAVIKVNDEESIEEINFNTLAFNGIGDFTFALASNVATIGIDYANSAITRKNQNEVITGGWNFSNAASVWNGGTISAVRGGTGINNYAAGDLLYASAANTLSKLSNTGADSKVLMIDPITHLPSWVSVLGAGGVTGSGTQNNLAIWGAGNTLTDLAVLGVSKGGTGLSSVPTNGQLLIGNGSGYTLANLTGSTGISVANGSGTVSITNTGVTQLSGTVNQITVSANTGAITISLPQNISTTADAAFASLSLSSPLTIASGGTGLASYAAGDILYYSSGNTFSRRAIGTDGQALTIVGGVPTWGSVAGSAHSILSASHSDATASSVTRGALISGVGVTPTWSLLAPGTSGYFLKSNGAGSDLAWSPTTDITQLGTIATGTWNATSIADNKIAAALTGKTYNGLTLSSLATGFSIAGGTSSKTLTISNSLTFAGTDSSTLNIGTGGTLASAAFTSSSDYATAAQGTLATNALPAASFTDTAVTGKLLTNFVSGAGTVVATDTILQAIQKLNGNISSNGNGTVTTVSVATANGVSGSVSNPTTTPEITLTLGNIVPTTVNGLTLASAADGFTVAGGTASRTLTILGANVAINQNLQTTNSPTFAGATMDGVLNIKSGTYKTGFQNSGTQAGDITYTLPVATGSSGQVLKIDASNNLYWGTVTGGTGGIGTVTSVGSGNGLTGGPITESGTLSVALLSANGGNASTSSFSGLQFSGALNNQLSLLQGCANNEVLAWDNTGKDWQCATVSGVGGITGTGVNGYVTYWTSANTLGNEQYLSTSRGGTGVSGAAASNGALLIGNGSGYSLATLSQGSNISITNGAGSISIATTTTPSFTTVNGLTLSSLATGFSIAGGTSSKTLTISNSLTFAGTDSSTLNIGTGGTLASAAFTSSSDYATAAQGTLATNALPAASFTDTAVTGKLLTNFVSGAGTVVATDTILQAIQKLNGNILGLGTLSALNSINNSNWSGTALAVTNGGTGATDAATARTNLGLAIGTDVQQYNASLAAIAGGTWTGANSITTLGTIGSGVWNGTTVSAQYGGTGVNGATAANGTLLIGNGTGFSLATLTASTGISVTNGAGSISIANTGVTSLAGTANQVAVSASTGDIIISLPQTINTTSNVAFNSLTLSTALAAQYGGTGYASYTIGDMLYANTTTTFGKIALGSDGQVLTLVGGVPSWSGGAIHSAVTLAGENYLSLTGQQITANAINLASTNVTGILPVANGGTGAIDAAGARTNLGLGSLATLSSVNNTNWSGTQLSVANGGTNATTIGAAGTVAYSSGTAYAFSAAGTTGRALISGGSGAPTWFAPTAGSLVFAGTNGILSENNSDLFWNSADQYLKIGAGTGLGMPVQYSMGVDISDSSKFKIFAGEGIAGTSQFVIDTNGVTKIGTKLGLLETGTSPTYYTYLQGGDQAADVTYTLPTASTNGLLKNTAGVLSWDATAYLSGTVGVTSGGTGYASYTIGDMLYANTTTTFGKIALGSDGQVLTLVGGVPTWSAAGSSHDAVTLAGENYLSLTGQQITANAINLASTNVTGILPVANGGTGSSTQFTQGSLVFAGAFGVYSQNNANLYWDNTNNYLRLGGGAQQFSMGVDTTDSNKFKIFQGNGIAGTSTFSIDASGVTSIASLSMGTQEFSADSGVISWIDMPVTSSAANGTVESYAASLDGNSMLTIYGTSDGSGGVSNLAVKVGAKLGLIETGTTPTYYTYLQGGDQAADVTYTLPTASTNGLLKNTAGVLSWDATTYLSGTVAIASGGTGATTAVNALNNLLPSQTSNGGKYLTTDGAGNVSWGSVGSSLSVAGTTDGSIQFKSGSSLGADSSNLLWDDTNNRLGLGTASPTNILSFGNSQNQKIWIENSASGTLGRSLTIAAGGTVAGGTNNAGGNLVLQSGLGTGIGASTISFETGTTLASGTLLQTMTTKMVILGSGNVGIGNTSPLAKLDVKGSDYSVNCTGSCPAPDTLIVLGGQGSDDDGDSMFAGHGGDLFLTGGTGGGGGTTTTSRGGDITMNGGVAGSGGRAGNILLASSRGSVGIGSIDATALLHLGGTNGKVSLEINSNATTTTNNVLAIRSDVASADDLIFRVQANGAVYADGAYTGTGADYAEYFYTKDTDLKSGEAVCVDVENENAVKRCQRSGDNNIIGIISTNPSVLGNAPDGREDNKNFVITAMLGQVPAKVSTENGSISVGDSLAAASVAGYLRKANAGESTVGIAIQNLVANKGTIQVLISRRNQSLTVEKVEEAVTLNIASMNIEDQVGQLVKVAEDNFNQIIANQLTVVSDLSSQLALQQKLIEILQSQMSELQIKANSELNIAQIDLNTQDIALIKLMLGVDADSTLGDIAISGKLKAASIETGKLIVAVNDLDTRVIGEGAITTIKKDENGDGKDDETKSDGKTFFVKTKAVNTSSRIFITPKVAIEQGMAVTEIKSAEGFVVSVKNIVTEDVTFDWVIVDEK